MLAETEMRMPVLILCLLVAGAAMAIWSIAGGAGWSVTATRVVVTLVAMQLCYLGMVLVIGGRRSISAGHAPLQPHRSEAARLDKAP